MAPDYLGEAGLKPRLIKRTFYNKATANIVRGAAGRHMLRKPKFGGSIAKVMPLGHVIIGILFATIMEAVLLRMFGILIHRLGTMHTSNAVALGGPAQSSQLINIRSLLIGLMQTAQISRSGVVGAHSN